MSTHCPPVLVPYDDISKMTKPISIFFFHRGTFFFFSFLLVRWYLKCHGNSDFFFASLAEAFVWLLAQIGFEN